MSFLIIMAVLIAERFLLPRQALRGADWFARWMEFQQSLPVGRGLRDGLAGLVFLLLPPLFLVLAILFLLGDLLGGLAGFLLAAVALLYSFGPRDLDQQVQQLLEAVHSGDPTRAKLIAGELPDADGGAREVDSGQVMAENVLVAAQRRIFGTLLWFLVLGPAGALLYRLAREAAQLVVTQARPGLEQPSRTLLFLLDWAPARMLAGLFALAGNFETAVKAWHRCDAADDDGLQLARCTGIGALQLDGTLSRIDNDTIEGAELHAAMSLVWRALVILLALLGLATLAAWLA
jgi:AmpE protein